MADRHEPVELGFEVERALADAIRPIPLDEDRIRATLQAARRLRRQTQIARFLRVALVLVTVASLAAGFWRWRGANSDKDLSLSMAMDIATIEGPYDSKNVQSAAGKVWRNALNVLLDLQKRGDLPTDLKNAVVEALDSREPVPADYVSGYEDLAVKLRDGETLTPAEVNELTGILRACVYTVRTLPARDTKFTKIANMMCSELRKVVVGKGETPPPEPQGPAR